MAFIECIFFFFGIIILNLNVQNSKEVAFPNVARKIIHVFLGTKVARKPALNDSW